MISEKLKPYALIVLTSLSFYAQAITAQKTGELSVSVIPSSPTAYGGEQFSYKAIVSNRREKTSDVMLSSNNLRRAEFVTAIPSQGTCEIEGPRGQNVALRCRFGDMPPESEVSVDVVIKLYDIDDETTANISETRRRTLETLAKFREALAAQHPEVVPAEEELIATVSVAGRNDNFNRENNYADLWVKLLPSRNVQPHLNIISPQSSATVVKRATSPFRLTIKMEARDSDGTVEKVTVQQPFNIPHPFVEDGQYKFRYRGKTFTVEELEEYAKTAPSDEEPATKTGPNTYEFVVTDVNYGLNRFHISAVDNGGRRASTTLEITAKGDAEVEIVSPKANQIVEPGSDLVFETVSVLNEGTVKEVMLFSSFHLPTHQFDGMRMTLVSKDGKTYKHRYVLKQIARQDYANIRAVLIEDSGAVSESSSIDFIVTKIPKISVLVEGGNSFARGTPIEIGFQSDAELRDITYEVHINGKLRSQAFTRFIWQNAEPGKHVVEIVAKIKGSGVELARSKPVTIVVR